MSIWFNISYVRFQELNLAVCGSQVVGLVPQDAIMLAADHYMKEDNLFLLEDDQKIRLVSVLEKKTPLEGVLVKMYYLYVSIFS